MALIIARLPHGDYVTERKDGNGKTVYYAHQKQDDGSYLVFQSSSKGKAKKALQLERKPQLRG